MDSSSTDVECWAWLPKDLLGSILSKLTDFPDFVRFSSVCRPWRNMALKDNNINDQQQHLQRQRLHILKTCHNQIPMLMLTTEEDKHNLYSITGERLYDDVPSPFSYNKRICGSSRGWLFTIDSNMIVTLINPLTGHTIPLPVFKDPDNEYQYWIDNCDYFIRKGILSSDPCLDPNNYEVVVIFGGMSTLAIFRSGDAAWTFKEANDGYIFIDFIYHNGSFYAVNNWNGIVHFDFASGTENFVIKSSSIHASNPKATYLVESQAGDLLMVQRLWKEKNNESEPDFREVKIEGLIEVKTVNFKVFKVSNLTRLEKATLVEIKSLGDQALFLGDNHSISVSVLEFPACKPNCIYYTDQVHIDFPIKYVPRDDDLGVFNVEDGSFGSYYLASPSQKHMQPPIWFLPNLRGK